MTIRESFVVEILCPSNQDEKGTWLPMSKAYILIDDAQKFAKSKRKFHDGVRIVRYVPDEILHVLK